MNKSPGVIQQDGDADFQLVAPIPALTTTTTPAKHQFLDHRK